MALDIDKLRAETDGCQGSLTHFNNAGASLMPSCVLKATRDHLDLENMIGGYEAAARMQPAMDQVYQNVARLINADTDEIALVNNATEGWNSAFYSLGWETGDRVITTRSEYNSNMIAFRHLEDRAGIEIVLTPDSEDGTLDLEALDRLIGARTKLVAVSHMPTNEGLVQPVEQVGKIVQAHNVPFLLDACQSVGQMPIDVRKIGCTMLSATGRKYLRGPRGTGFLWMRRDWIVRTTPHVLDSRSAYWDRVDGFTIAPDARRFELWEKNVAGLLGLGAACRYAHDIGLEQVWTRIRKSSAALRNGLKAIPGITVQDRGGVKSGIVTFCHDTIGASEFVDRLREDFRINTSVSDTQLTRQILTRQGVLDLVRASLHAFNSDAEISSLIEAVEAIGRAGREPTEWRLPQSRVTSAERPAPGDAVSIIVRPENLMPGAPTSKGQVCLICHRTDHIFLGDRVHLELMAEDGTKIRMDAHPTAVPDADQFAVHFDPQNTVVIANTNNIRTGEL